MYVFIWKAVERNAKPRTRFMKKDDSCCNYIFNRLSGRSLTLMEIVSYNASDVYIFVLTCAQSV